MGGGSLWTWDGVKWEAGRAAVLVTSVAPASGATVVMTGRQPLYINNVAVLATLIICLPPAPIHGQFAEISFRNPVTALTILNSAGAAITGSPTNAYGPGAAIFMCYVDDIVGWVLWK